MHHPFGQVDPASASPNDPYCGCCRSLKLGTELNQEEYPVTPSSVLVRMCCSLPITLALIVGSSGNTLAQDDPRKAMEDILPSCLPRFAEIDARIEKAGVSDASYHRVPGFPYLRSDRLLASYDAELDDPATFDTWMLQLRDNDGFSRDIELRNLGMPDQERANLLTDLRLCAVWLSFIEFSEPEKIAALKAGIQLPDPAAPVAASAAALPSTTASENARALRAVVTEDAESILARYDKLPRDELARTGMTNDGWKALAEHYAPTWLMARGSPGALVWTEDGLEVDPSQPTVYFQPTFARVGDQGLVQYHYVLWFALADGGIDGLIWRVTLDPRGRPLVHESLDAQGQRHQWFPAQALEARADLDLNLAAPLGVGQIAVTLSPDGHQVLEVAPRRAEAYPEETPYRLALYEDLLTLPLPGGGSRSAFDAQGRLRTDASQTRQPILWQLGQLRLKHADAPLPFDDPRLLEAYFTLPAMSPRELARR